MQVRYEAQGGALPGLWEYQRQVYVQEGQVRLHPTLRFLLGSPLDDTPIFVKSRRYQPDKTIPEPRRWVHVAAVFVEEGTWRVIDCQDCRGGVTEYGLAEAIAAYGCRFEAVLMPYPWLCVARLRERLGTPYSPRKAVRLARLSRHPMPPPKAGLGVTCGELIALCDGGFMEDWSGKRPYDVRPVDFQRLAKLTGTVAQSVRRIVQG